MRVTGICSHCPSVHTLLLLWFHSPCTLCTVVSRDVCFFLFRQVKCIDQMLETIKSMLNQGHHWCKGINEGQPMVFGNIDSSVRWLLKTLSIWSILLTSLSRVGINIRAHIKLQYFDVAFACIEPRGYIPLSAYIPCCLTPSARTLRVMPALHRRAIGQHGMERSSCLSVQTKGQKQISTFLHNFFTFFFQFNTVI